MGALTSAATRREFLVSGAAALGSFSGLAAQSVSPQLVKTYSHMTVESVAPDGKTLCLEDWKASGPYPLSIVEFGSWRKRDLGSFGARTIGHDYFADSQALWIEVDGANSVRTDIAVDLTTGKRTERKRSYEWQREPETTAALGRRELLIAHYYQSIRRVGWLSRIDLLTGVEQARLTYPPLQKEGRWTVGWDVTNDRSLATSTVDGDVVLVETEGLSIRWTRPVPPGLMGWWPSFSSDGRYLALTMVDSLDLRHQKVNFVSVFDTATGDARRLDVKVGNRIALSHDGAILAVVVNEPTKGALLPTVHLHDVESGRRLASCVHARVPDGRHQFLDAGCLVYFTSDGRYMITSSMDTKIWSLTG